MNVKAIGKIIIAIAILTFSLVVSNMTILGLFYGIIFVSIAYWLNYSAQYEVLRYASFLGLGFRPKKQQDALASYYIGQHEKIRIKHRFVSTNPAYPFSIIIFTITRGHGKQRMTFRYIGFEFTTHQEHYSVQLRDPDSAIYPTKSTKRQLEGNEFNNVFSVYSEEAEAPFHFLDPDTMADLIDTKAKLPIPLNMDASGHTILLFIEDWFIDSHFRKRLSVLEVLNGKPTPKRVEEFTKSNETLFSVVLHLFSLLDYTLKRD